ncbi:MAG: type II secretion system F family protein [Pseudomonadota bacterium]|nr:type II secretion system F family protein [Pseudomonadota bacterium]
MASILSSNWIVIPAVSALIFLITFLWADRVIAWFHFRSLGQRAEVIRLLELMFIEVNESRVTAIMLLTSFGLGFVVFLLCWPNIILGFFVGLVFSLLGATVPKLTVTVLYERRCKRFVDQMIDGMTIMANGIKAGLTVQVAMERVAQNLRNPIRQEFNYVLSKIRIGRTIEEALIELGERIPKPDVQMFVTSVNILREQGGNLAETFETIAYTVRERQKIEKKIDALTAQGVTQGVIITLVPFVLMIVMFFIQPDFIKPLFTTFLGIIFLSVMLILQIIGGIMIRRIVKINV